ncbi:hypothetical protein CAEBREN_00222 [Caenorhabditis brenneri]|uniref:Uncharacterized protein n=1 Tax=Caenorhabditis brenneri TaxID=135651 RepID=G0MDI5_CAEBE|nr:hypothetical protein CAEBREN_00222 [Caenorhabditis brenneri]
MSFPNKIVFMGLDVPADIESWKLQNKEDVKNARAKEEKVVDLLYSFICQMYLDVPDKEKTEQGKEICCEFYSYCSITNKVWFWPTCIGAGFILLNLISIVVLCLVCRKRGGRSMGGLDVEKVKNEEKVEEIDMENDDN